MNTHIYFEPSIKVDEGIPLPNASHLIPTLTTYKQYISAILDRLEIIGKLRTNIHTFMDKYSDPNKYKIITTPKLAEFIINLLLADRGIIKLLNTEPFDNYINNNLEEFNTVLSNIVKLQGYIILRKINPSKSDTIVVPLINRFNTNISNINKLIELHLIK